MPHFYKGYDKYLDLTEEEYWDQQAENSVGEYDEDINPGWVDVPGGNWEEPEGEPYEDSYFLGIPDYDRFNRPSWGTDVLED